MKLFKYAFPIFICLVFFAGCDDSPSYYNKIDFPLKWYSSLQATWRTDDSLSLAIKIWPGPGNYQQSGMDAEITIRKAASANGPWEILHQEHQAGRSSWSRDVPVYFTGSDDEMLFFRLDTKITYRKRTEAAYSGPVVATTRPMLRPGKMSSLPDIVASSPYDDAYDPPFRAPAVSPDGQSLFLANNRGRIFDLVTGTEFRSSAFAHQGNYQGNASWLEGSIVISGYSLISFDIEAFGVENLIEGTWSFQRNDSLFVVIESATKWTYFSPGRYTNSNRPAEFAPSASYTEHIGAISQRPGTDTYIAGRPDRLFDIWWVYDKSFKPVRAISPIDMAGLDFEHPIFGEYSFDEVHTRSVIWLSGSRVLLSTYWSGSEEYWLCDLDAGTFRQLTGFHPVKFPVPDRQLSRYRIQYLYPCFDRANNRLLFFFPRTATIYAIRTLPVP